MLLCKSFSHSATNYCSYMYGHKWEGEHNGNCWKYNRIIYNTRLCSWASCFVCILRSHTKRLWGTCSQFVIFCLLLERTIDFSSSVVNWVDEIVFLWSGEVWHQLSRTNAGRVNKKSHYYYGNILTYPDVTRWSNAWLHNRMEENISDVASDTVGQDGGKNQGNECQHHCSTNHWSNYSSAMGGKEKEEKRRIPSNFPNHSTLRCNTLNLNVCCVNKTQMIFTQISISSLQGPLNQTWSSATESLLMHTRCLCWRQPE